jgi:hypothetical protein
MKLALITDPKGFPFVKDFGLSYHLVLAQYVLEGFKYRDFYKDCHDRGDFIMLDNGAAEEGTLTIDHLVKAAEDIHADEIILPDVMGEYAKTLDLAFDSYVQSIIPPRKRAVVPQGNNIDEWMTCANYFVENMDFRTMCIPKHTERFPGGRLKILHAIKSLGWDTDYNIHLLGVWDNPVYEVATVQTEFPWVRGIDTAAPFAWAQENVLLKSTEHMGHISHVWGKSFNRETLKANIEHLHYLATRTT